MKKSLLVFGVAALALTGCGGSDGDTVSAPSASAADPEQERLCAEFQSKGPLLVEFLQAEADQVDQTLTQAQRDKAHEFYANYIDRVANEIGTGKSRTLEVPEAARECTGPVWLRFFKEGTAPTPTAAATSTPYRPYSADPEYNSYMDAMSKANIAIRDTDPRSGTFSTDKSICTSIREGRVDAYQLAGREGVAAQDENGRRVTAMIPILCPDQQAVLDEARSGNPTMRTFLGGNYIVGIGYNPSGPRLVAPGTYRTGPVSDCYWERADSQGNILDNNFVTISQSITVTITPQDGAFSSRGCGSWTLVE